MNNYEEVKAARIGVRLVKARMQMIAWDRNVFHRAGARYPGAVHAAKEWDELEAALKVFEEKIPERAGKKESEKSAQGKPGTLESTQDL